MTSAANQPTATAPPDGDFHHVSVMLEEVVQAVAAAPGGWLVDCTLGGGGHSEAILARCPQLSVLGLDRDPAALHAASQRLAHFGERFTCVHAPFSQLTTVVAQRGWAELAAVIADLGVSSHQFDTAARGFSFRQDGPLDMRMDPSAGTSLEQRLDTVTLEDLADVLYQYGDIRRSIGTARIVLDSFREGAHTTGQLAADLERRLPRERSHHPATAVFQALRIWVNGELDEVETLLRDAPGLLAPGGVLAVLSFHSGEDRLVKHAFHDLAPKRYGGPYLRDRDVAASQNESARNPRARSARLRVLRRVDAATSARQGQSETIDTEEAYR